MTVARRSRGYLRTGGYYGRYNQPGGARNSETKFFDQGFITSMLVGGNVALNSIHQVQQGVGEEQRIGRKITLTSIHGSFIVRLPSVTDLTNAANVWRFVIVQDKQVNGAVASWLDVFQSTGFHSYRNMENIRRFKILFDKRLAINSGGAAGDAIAQRALETQYYFRFNKKCNIPIDFDNISGSGDISTMKTNNVFVLVASASTSEPPLVSGTFRVRYSDN